MRTKSLQLCIGLTALCTLAIGMATINVGASATSVATLGSMPGAPAAQTPYAPQCGPDWQFVPGMSGNISDIAAISDNDAWAVGGDGFGHVIEHWDGSRWSVVPDPWLPRGNELYGVTELATDDVWAVGAYDNGETLRSPLAMHWDGSVWSVVPVPAPNGATHSYLMAVDALSATDIWAVGRDSDKTLIEHWDGSTWSVVPSPNGGTFGSYLYGVAAISSNDVWAVGNQGGGITETLVEHWNGSSWSVIPSPNVGAASNVLKGVAAISSNDVWAVGFNSDSWTENRTLVEHWDGSTWSVVPSPNGNTGSGGLNAVAALSTNDVWAVGYRDNYQSFIVHWSGAMWSTVPSPSFNETNNSLNGIDATSSSDVWAVGGVLAERYNPSYCPTPSPGPRCPGERFTDVCPADYFYQHVLQLNDISALSGYRSAPPCDGLAHIPCFKPYSWTTRGQIAKIVSNSAGFAEPVSGQNFEDVGPGTTFFDYVGRLANHGVLNGYPCGGPGEPCGPDNLPYFRTGNTVGRGQLTKIAALTFGINEPVSTQTFQDVPTGYTFYVYVERLAVRGIVGGYPCGEPGEPCIAPENRAYFRPANPISRGQVAKIVNLARTLTTPTPTMTPTLAPATPTITPTNSPVGSPVPSASPQTPTPTPTPTPSSTTFPQLAGS